ncbi:MAG: glycoside hydrolase family 127 protein [Treponema sp.]|nr:glycoside hydrolase family 127 protein [Treponema sp.]
MHTIKITDRFFTNYRDLVREKMIPYQYKVLNDEIAVNIERERNDNSIPNEKSHCLENFRIAAGLRNGEHYGWQFQDSDVYKWLEAVSYSLMEKPDDNLKAIADSVVDLIALAQEEDGYISTYFQLKCPERKFKDLAWSHELYCAGHLMEAAVAYYEATGSEKVLAVARKNADCICRYFGTGKGQTRGFDGHEEVEIGLMRLYHLTGDENYLQTAVYFLDERGQNPDIFIEQSATEHDGKPDLSGILSFPKTYFQIHKPVLEQDTAEGHAVRMMYLATAMADVSLTTGNKKLYEACKKIWHNVVDRRMYITGGVGSSVIGESFTFDYNLPNDTMYCETCASVALMFFAQNMLLNEARGEYADVMERALYNTVLDGMALDGRHFFYVNPLEVTPEASAKDPGKSHVKPVRPEWLGCACCPPNLARLLASLDRYAFHEKDGIVFADLFMNAKAEFPGLTVEEETEYPWQGNVMFSLKTTTAGSDAKSACEIRMFAVRIPGWTAYTTCNAGTSTGRCTVEGEEAVRITLNGKPLVADSKICGKAAMLKDGYLYLTGPFEDDVLKLEFAMPVIKMSAHPFVRADNGKIAVMRGPLVYALESIDNGTGLNRLFLRDDTAFTWQFRTDLLNGVGIVKGKGYRIPDTAGRVWQEYPAEDSQAPLYAPYSSDLETKAECVELTWIPYFAWANRGINEMSVWIRQK